MLRQRSTGTFWRKLPARAECAARVAQDGHEQQGRASWVQVGEDGKLDVRYRGTEQELPSGDDLPELWRNGYFIDSLKAITRQLGAPA